MRPVWNAPPTHADVVIIGGGLVGCAIAKHLADRNIECCLIERDALASGASGRNDGQIILETVDYYPRMKEIYGAKTAHAILDFKRRGQILMQDFLAERDEWEQLAFHQAGSLTLAVNEAEAKAIEGAVDDMARDGFASQLLDCDQIEARMHTRRFKVGKLDPVDATVNPAEMTRLFAAAAKEKGASIYEHCPVTRVEDGVVYHAAGQTQAEVVILATNAHTPLLDKSFENLIFPIRGQVLATEPTDIRIDPYACITNFGYDYWHWTPDGRLIVGGCRTSDEHNETGYDLNVNPTVHNALEDFIKDTWPQYHEQLKVAHRWSGTMGFSKDGIPLVGPIGGDPSYWAAAGFTGYGLGMCWAVGLGVAQILNDEQSPFTEYLSLFSPGRFQ